MAAVRHLGFLKVGNFNCPYPSEVQNASPCQILCRSVKPLRRYGRLYFSRWRPSVAEIWPFTFFQDGGRPPFYKFTILTAHALWRSKMHHHAKFCANRSRHCGDMAVFDFSRWRRSDLGFLKVGNFNCPYSSEVLNASPSQILCRSVEPLRRYGRLKFFKMAAVRHLGFVIRLFGPPTKCILVVSVIVQNLI